MERAAASLHHSVCPRVHVQSRVESRREARSDRSGYSRAVRTHQLVVRGKEGASDSYEGDSCRLAPPTYLL